MSMKGKKVASNLLISRYLEEHLIELDRIGIFPQTMEDLLILLGLIKNPYEEIMEKIRNKAEKILEKITGHEIPVKIYTEHEDEFYSVFGTKPFPTLEIEEKYKSSVKLPIPTYTFLLFPFCYFIYKNIRVGGRLIPFELEKSYNVIISGITTLRLKGKKKIDIPVIFSKKNEDKNLKKFKAIHENVHAIRREWRVDSLNFLKEELYGFSYIPKKLSELRPRKIKSWKMGCVGGVYGLLYGIGLGLNTPYLLALAYSLYPLGLVYPIVAGATLGMAYSKYYFRKIKKFVKKCEEENINPYYLMLRSNIEEFNLKKSIRKQIERKAKHKLRFKIIELRLKRDPPPLDKEYLLQSL